jgi:hypothetical protein
MKTLSIKRSVFICVATVVTLQSHLVFCQSATAKDPSAVATLGEVLSVGGGAVAISSNHGYKATGTITYYWAGKEVTGRVVLRSRGLRQFRLDASLPDGVRSWWVSNGAGALKESNGTVSTVPYHNTVSLESLALPLQKLEEALRDPHVYITDLGKVNLGGQQVDRIRIQQQLTDKQLSKLTIKEYFVDSKIYQVMAVHDQTHPKTDMRVNIPHAFYYSDYRTVKGLSLPFSITETVDTQRTWALTLDEITIGSELSNSDFSF